MSNTISDDVLSVISDVFSPREVLPNSKIGALEADSVSLLRLMVVLQRRFNVTLDVVDMFNADDVGDLVRLVEERVRPERGYPRCDLKS